MSGVDKVMLELGGRSLLRRALDAVAGAEPVVVVGPRREVSEWVLWTREEPPGAGPVAALAAGLAVLPAGTKEVAVLAADLLNIGESTVDRLRAALGCSAGALLVDADGRRQWLIGVWRLEPLRRVMPADPAGRSLRSVLGALRVVEVAAGPGETADVDTPEDLP